MSAADEFEKNVFINCPFDDKYLELLQPILFAIIYFGFNPRIATERVDAGEQRIEKICELIHLSRLSIHDLSRLKATKKNEFYRLNMPFELGIDYALRQFLGGRFSEKRFLVLGKDQYDYAKALSDIAGIDIRNHNDEPVKVIRVVRNWLTQFIDNNIDAPNVVWEKFNLFTEHFYDERVAQGFSEDDIYEMPIAEYMSYIREWLKA